MVTPETFRVINIIRITNYNSYKNGSVITIRLYLKVSDYQRYNQTERIMVITIIIIKNIVLGTSNGTNFRQ